MEQVQGIEGSQSVTANSLSNVTDVSRDSLKDSLAKVIGSLTKSDKDGSSLAHEKVSEDVLYVALVAEQLKDKCPAELDVFLGRLGDRFTRLLRKRERQPLLKAANTFLIRQVKKGNLSHREMRAIKKFAFGKAQLNTTRTGLAHRMINIVDSSERSDTAVNIEAVLDKVESNSVATRGELRKFRGVMRKRGDLTKEGARLRRSFLKDINPANPPKIDDGPTETDKPCDPPSSKHVETTSTEFVYKPESEKDGNALIVLPQGWSDDVDKVSIFTLDDEHIADFKHYGKGNDGRTYFRWDKPGLKLGKMMKVVMHAVDGKGDYLYELNAQEFYRKDFG